MQGKAAIIIVAMLGLHGPAKTDAQTLQIIEGAYELTLGNVYFPSSTVGSVIFRSCAQCESRTLRVDTGTRYLTARGTQPLPDFLDQVAELKTLEIVNDHTPVTVFYSMDSGRVTRISVHDQAN
jgi:hypothetical protein